MKTLIFIFSLLLSWTAMATGAIVTCSTSSAGVTTCDSSDSSVNVVSSGSSTEIPKSSIVIKSPDSGVVDVRSDTNTKSTNVNLFVSSGGTPSDLSIDLSSKWDATKNTANLAGAANASNLVLVSDVIGNLSVDVSGYNGKSGTSSAQICASKILNNEYGADQANKFKARCNDGSSGSPCTPEKIRSSCDETDLVNIAGSIQNVCPDGFNYMSGNDGFNIPSIPVTKQSPITLKKCERGSFQGTARYCAYKETICRYKMKSHYGNDYIATGFIGGSGTTTIQRLYFRDEKLALKGLKDIPLSHITNFTVEESKPFPNLAYPSYVLGTIVPMAGRNYPRNVLTQYDFPNDNDTVLQVSFTIKSNDYSSTNGTCPQLYWWDEDETGSADFHHNRGDQYCGGATSATSGNESICLPGLIYNGNGDQYARMVQTWVADVKNDQIKVVPQTEPCNPDTETDRGLFPMSVIPSDIKFTLPENSCPPPAKDSFSNDVYYGASAISAAHGLTQPFMDFLNNKIEPLATSLVNCSNASCEGVAKTYSSRNLVDQRINLGSGETGSYGGKASVFAYDIQGSINFRYSNGSGGLNGVDNLPVNQLIKNCVYLQDDNTLTPQVQFYQSFLKVLEFIPSAQSQIITFPARSENEAVKVFKKVSPGVRALIKEATCPSCP